VPEYRLDQGGTVADRGHHLVTVLGEQADQALAQQHRVVGHHDPQRTAGAAAGRRFRDGRGRVQQHGSSAVIVVGPPEGLVTRSVPPAARSRWSSPRRPCPFSSAAPPAPSSVTQAVRVPAS
jgi:hypothetical protein